MEAFMGLGWVVPFLGVPVGAGAGVVAADGVQLEAFPHVGLEVVPEVLRFGHPHTVRTMRVKLGG